MNYQILFMGAALLFVIGFVQMVILGIPIATPYFAVAIGLQTLGFAIKYK